MVADKVMELASMATLGRSSTSLVGFDGKVREQVELTPNHNLKIRYESYEEARAALLEQGVNIDRLPMLTDMRVPEGRSELR